MRRVKIKKLTKLINKNKINKFQKWLNKASHRIFEICKDYQN